MENKIEITNNPSNINLDYDEISPITENKCVILEGDTKSGEEHRMCMESGYVTRTSLVPNSKECSAHELGCTELMKKLKLVDMNLNSVWYPTFMQMSGGMLYCEGNGASPGDYKWSIAKVVPIEGEERKKYPIPGKENEYYTSRLDTDNAQKFNAFQFEEALDTFYKVIRDAQNDNKNEQN